ncbi:MULTISPECIES: flavin reductase family protein [Actinosynnema]|uniref:flavin reductase family protein n=1 Tax=Actinosynnema TaxID=40566 RepID=UPI0020A4C313|nr:flavin reductase family protein [Actinosynnema pretiosum]MCP2094976.1 NADH-FMN oxidoreductase RutF, flavin reductase (DIM6/NTAB) family [Actinosynnema pretiosum]
MSTRPAAPQVSRPALREAMRTFATGVTVLTTAGRSTHGMTANAFSSVSLEPPLVLCCVARTALMHAAITEEGEFAVSVLAQGQEHVARYFADRSRPQGAAQFDGVGWRPGERTGAPLLAGALAWLECRVAHAYDGGDHAVFVGEVLSATTASDGAPLVFFGGRYRRLDEG